MASTWVTAEPGPPVCPVNLLDPAVRAAPYDAYRVLRETAPVCRAPFGPWIVSRHADAAWLLDGGRCDHWGLNPAAQAGASSVEAALADGLRLLGPDGPAPIRRAAAEAMGPRALAGLEQELDETADGLLRAARASATLEVIDDYATPLTFRAISRVFAIDGEQGTRLEHLTRALGGGFFSALIPPGAAADSRGAPKLTLFLLQMVQEARRAQPAADTLVDRLIAAAPETPDRDLINLLLILLFASHHNMIGFIGNALVALAGDPKAASAIADRMPCPADAVLELLRFDPPLQFLALIARETLQMGGQIIAAGEPILLAIGAANHDPDAWPDPDRLNFARDTRGQLSFGVGAWRCLGARLAQAIAGVALGRLSRAVGVPRLAAPPLWHLDGPFVQRGPRAVRIALGQAARW